jgi:hypothetical protein
MRGLRALGATLVAAGLLASSIPGASSRASESWIDNVRDATRPFHNVVAAKQAGYTFILKTTDGVACIENGAGDMGIHFVNPKLLGDAKIRALKPEALMYEPQSDGSKKLVAVEWVVFRKAWINAGHTGAPRLWGHRFNLVPAGNDFGVPAFFELHAWIWKANPSGMFYEWNPRVHCP